MATLKKLLPYQSAFLQAPIVYDNIRYFMLITGYGAGKTSSLVDSLCFDVSRLQGKKDREGRSPLLMLAGVTLTFMKRTCVHDLLQALDNSKTFYKYHKDINQIEIGDVTIVLQAIEDPSSIYGLNCLTSDTRVIVRREGKVRKVRINKVLIGDEVITRKGWKPVSAVLDRGMKKVQKVKYGKYSVYCTPDHRIFDVTSNSFVNAQDLTSDSKCATLDSDVNEWKDNPDFADLLKYVKKSKRKSVLKIGKLSRKEKHVYDISVEDEHEFYGNGILLHNCACIYVDELDELPAEIAMEAVRSLNERLRQQLVDERPPYAKWTTTSQGLKGLYQTVMQFKASGIPYMIIRARTRDNIYLPKEYVDSMYAMYNEKERRCFLEGEFLSVDSGLVFPDYDPAKNDLTVDLYDSLQPDDVVYVSQDFNQNNNNAQAFIVKKGAIIMIKDYIFPDIRRSPEVLRYDFPEQKIVWIPDMTYKEHFGEFKKELRQYKIFIAYRACNPNVTDRNFAVNKCLYSERLFICPCCEDSKKSLMTHQIDPKTLKPMKGGIGAPDHKSDCLGMAVHYLLTWHKDMKDIYKLTLGRRYLYRDDPSARLGNQVVAADRIMRGKITEDNDEGEIAV